MEVEEGLDTGGIYRRTELADRSARDGRQADRAPRQCRGRHVWCVRLAEGLGAAEPQSGSPSYAAKISQSDLRLDFTRTADELERVVLVGRAWTTWRGRRLLVLDAVAEDVPPVVGFPGLAGSIGPDARVVTGRGWLRLITLQPAGRAPVSARRTGSAGRDRVLTERLGR